MSLLLDALKKASDDKKKVVLSDASDVENNNADEIGEFPQVDEEKIEANQLQHKENKEIERVLAKESSEDAMSKDDQDIVLDLEMTSEELTANAKSTEVKAGNNVGATENYESYNKEASLNSVAADLKKEDNKNKENTEALSALINKSNSYNRKKRKNKIILSIVLGLTLFLSIVTFYVFLINEKNSVVYIKNTEHVKLPVRPVKALAVVKEDIKEIKIEVLSVPDKNLVAKKSEPK